MTTLSGCVTVRDAVRLDYPLRESVASYLPICDEVVIAYDPTSRDGTEGLVRSIASSIKRVRLVQSGWDLTNRTGGSEIAVQSNVAIDACRCEWILYVQADEALHENTYGPIRELLADAEATGGALGRRSFLGSLDREITGHRVSGLLRLFRRGTAVAVGDAMTCAYLPAVEARTVDLGMGLFNYSRFGDPEVVARRSRNLHSFYHGTEQEMQERLAEEEGHRTSAFDREAHPAPIRARFAATRPAAQPAAAFPITLGVLLGHHERQNIVPFLWQFTGWAGDIIVVDDMTADGSAEVLKQAAGQLLGIGGERLRILRRPLRGDFSAARNAIHDASRNEWILHADLDERWNPGLVRSLPDLVRQLEEDGKEVCGFPRANFLDGLLVNDIPGAEWTRERLLQALMTAPRWPPVNRDVHFRLMKRTHRWQGALHESAPGSELVVVLREPWVLHHKSYERQLRQDRFYRSLGQENGMPDNDPHGSEANRDARPGPSKEHA